jgi:hypothetical protein
VRAQLFDVDVLMDSHGDPSTRLSEIFEVSIIVHCAIHIKYLQRTDLRVLDPGGQCLRMT